MKVKISNLKLSALDSLINSDIINVDDNTQIVFGDRKKVYKQNCKYRIDISLDYIFIQSINIYVNTVSISEHDSEVSDYLPSADGYIITDISSNRDPYIEYDTCLLSTLKNFLSIRSTDTLMCDLIIDI